jgi:hypothetical protein
MFELGIHSGKPSDSFVDFTILTELTAFPFHSVHTLASTLKVAQSMTWNHLPKEPFVVKHLRWVDRRLDDRTKRTQMTQPSSSQRIFEKRGIMVGRAS